MSTFPDLFLWLWCELKFVPQRNGALTWHEWENASRLIIRLFSGYQVCALQFATSTFYSTKLKKKNDDEIWWVISKEKCQYHISSFFLSFRILINTMVFALIIINYKPGVAVGRHRASERCKVSYWVTWRFATGRGTWLPAETGFSAHPLVIFRQGSPPGSKVHTCR